LQLAGGAGTDAAATGGGAVGGSVTGETVTEGESVTETGAGGTGAVDTGTGIGVVGTVDAGGIGVVGTVGAGGTGVGGMVVDSGFLHPQIMSFEFTCKEATLKAHVTSFETWHSVCPAGPFASSAAKKHCCPKLSQYSWQVVNLSRKTRCLQAPQSASPSLEGQLEKSSHWTPGPVVGAADDETGASVAGAAVDETGVADVESSNPGHPFGAAC
jgi:hypothetical protein